MKKHIFKGFTLLSTTLLTQQIATANPAGRITGPTDPGARCNMTLTGDQCAAARKHALDTGCVVKEEHDALARYNSFPVCGSVFPGGPTGLLSWCSCGCVHPDTVMAIKGDEVAQLVGMRAEELAYNRIAKDLITLSSETDFTGSDLVLSSNKVEFATEGPALKDLVQIKTLDGRVLKLTQTHPVVLADGSIKQAIELRPDDLVLTIEGDALDIVSLETIPYEGNVYNFATDASLENPFGHVVFGQGLAIGDLTLEALLNEHKQSVELRK